MPFPAQVQRDALIAEARRQIEANGLDQLTLASLASACGIAAPSLYHHFRSKTALLQAINAATASDLTAHLIQAMRGSEGADAVRAMFTAYRAFARAQPRTYALLFGQDNPEARLEAQVGEALALPLQRALASMFGEAHSLDGLRAAWALVHGFVSLEISGQFQREGDLDGAFETAIALFTAGLSALKR